MGPPFKLPDQDFIKLFRILGATKLGEKIGLSHRSIYKRREKLEARYGITLTAPMNPNHTTTVRPQTHPQRIDLEIPNGRVLVGSDAHIWPGPLTPAMRGFIQFVRELKPAAVIMNGDVMDFGQISRHDPLGWEKHPEVAEELEAAQEILHAIAVASGRAHKIWTWGNHDWRFEARLASRANEYRKVTGVHLKDHFPLWQPCWSVWINGDTVIKHRFRSGIHAPWNNVLNAGTHMVTAHLHSAKVIPFTHYKGTLYGVDCGCLADPFAKAFTYAEDNPRNWRAGFCVLEFRNGRLLQPQIALVHDEHNLDYCGNLIPIRGNPMRGLGDVVEPDFGKPGDFLASDPDDNQGNDRHAGRRKLVRGRNGRGRAIRRSRSKRRP